MFQRQYLFVLGAVVKQDIRDSIREGRLNIREGLSYDDVLLVPKHSSLKKRADADISGELFHGRFLDVPILSANMPSVTGGKLAYEMYKSGGIGVAHRFGLVEDLMIEYCHIVDVTIFSLGLKDGLDNAQKLHRLGARMFCLDVAHGDHQQVSDFILEFRRAMPKNGVRLMVGNIATKSAIQSLPIHLVDAVKVGIGPGAACRTREVTGFGVPQLTAIMDVKEGLDYLNPYATIVADGGIKNSGDIVKALAAGADTVMTGKLLAGCVEAPNGLEYFGNASAQMNGHRAPEGAHGAVEASGTVSDVMKELAWGIKSGVSYGGARNLKELRANAEFIKVSSLTALESSVRV